MLTIPEESIIINIEEIGGEVTVMNWFEIISAISIVTLIVFLIILILHVKKTLKNFDSTMGDFRETLKSLKNSSDEIGAIARDLRNFTGSVKKIGQNIEEISNELEDLSYNLSSRARALKVAVIAGLSALLKKTRKEENNERRRTQHRFSLLSLYPWGYYRGRYSTPYCSKKWRGNEEED
jgi:uncharacterized protein YoxC